MRLDVGEKIKNLRIDKGLTQDELAERLSTQNPVKLYSNTIPNVTNSGNVLRTSDDNDYYSKVKLALFVGCKTAAGAENNVHNNLPAKIVEQGATVAIGFYDDIVCPQGNNWMEYFYQAFLAGYTVQDSISYALEMIDHQQQSDPEITNREYYKLDSIQIYGDDSLCIDDVRGG